MKELEKINRAELEKSVDSMAIFCKEVPQLYKAAIELSVINQRVSSLIDEDDFRKGVFSKAVEKAMKYLLDYAAQKEREFICLNTIE